MNIKKTILTQLRIKINPKERREREKGKKQKKKSRKQIVR